MKTNLLSKLTKNLALKIISVVIAIVIWYVVVDFNDPIETESYSVRIEVTNESYISNGKQIYRIADEYKTVTVYIKGNRSKLKRVQSGNIKVTADLTQIVDLERDPVTVPLQASCPGFSMSDITLSRATIPIVIENVAIQEFPVTVTTGDTSPGKDYEVGVLTSNPDRVTINGPESIVNQIESVVAKIDVTGMTQDGIKSAELKLYDKNQVEIEESTIKDHLTFDGGVPDINVKVELWKKRSGVKLSVAYSGTPADGYQITEITTSPTEITVAGDENALSILAEQNNTISIPADRVSVEGAKADLSMEVELSDLLPADLKLSSTMKDSVMVYVTVLPNGSREFSLDVEDIRTENLASDLAVSYDQSEFKIRVKGSDSALNMLDLSQVTAVIDLKGKSIGDYTVPVKITLPAGYQLVDEVNITIHLKEKPEVIKAGEQ